MAFVEPNALLHDVQPPSEILPRWDRESPAQIAKLARVWHVNGLLHICTDLLPVSAGSVLSRVFNCYKAPDKDRQIGDRRGRNFVESRAPDFLLGPCLARLSLILSVKPCFAPRLTGRIFTISLP